MISNASDALEKRRCKHLESSKDANIAYEIKITTDEDARLIIFEDNGIGMDKEDLVNCLGTIAKSGGLYIIYIGLFFLLNCCNLFISKVTRKAESFQYPKNVLMILLIEA